MQLFSQIFFIHGSLNHWMKNLCIKQTNYKTSLWTNLADLIIPPGSKADDLTLMFKINIFYLYICSRFILQRSLMTISTPNFSLTSSILKKAKLFYWVNCRQMKKMYRTQYPSVQRCTYTQAFMCDHKHTCISIHTYFFSSKYWACFWGPPMVTGSDSARTAAV